MKSEVTITPAQFDEKVFAALNSLLNTGINPCTPGGAASIIKCLKKKVFEDEAGAETKYYTAKSFESTHATIKVSLPEGMKWEDLPDELKDAVTNLSKDLIKKGETHEIKIG